MLYVRRGRDREAVVCKLDPKHKHEAANTMTSDVNIINFRVRPFHYHTPHLHISPRVKGIRTR